MRNIDANFMKLFILAGHLQSEDINNKYTKNSFLQFDPKGMVLFNEGDGIHYNFLYPFIINELPVLFHEWIVHNGLIVYKPGLTLLNAFAFCEFMGLETEEFYEVFIPKNSSSDDKKELDAHSKPADVSEKIFQFLDIKLLERAETPSIPMLEK